MKHRIGKTGLRVLCALAVIAPLAGCGLGTTTIAGSAATSAGAGTPLSSPGAIGGHVHSGLNPVIGAKIQLYSVSTSGYGTAATPLIPTSAQVVYNSSATAGTTGALTASDGSFNISGTYSCPANSYVYITASGGNPGAGINNNLALMAALGSCATLKANAATTSVWINEVTTVAAAYALAQFSGGTTYGTALSAQPGVAGSTAPADNFATSSTNIQGVANAMAIANVLANTSNGTTPGANANLSATAEYWTINTIADILSVCVNDNTGVTGFTLTSGGSFYLSAPTVTISGGGGSGAAATATVDLTPTDATYGQVTGLTLTAVGAGYTSAPTVTIAPPPVGTDATATAGIANSSGCSTLFTDATPATGSKPGDTIQVALQMALHPGDATLLAGTPSGSTLDGLISTTPPFQPYVNTTISGNTINDWTIGINYAPTTTAGGSTTVLSNPNYIAIDGYGNAWVSNIAGSGASSTSTTPSLVELDPTGNPIQAGSTAGTYSISTYNYGGTTNTLATTSSGVAGPTYNSTFMGVALDLQNNAYSTDYAGGYIFEVTSSAPQVTISAPASGTTATATATVSNGVITALNIVSPGSGYTSAPTVTIAGGGGSGATATATLTSGSVSALTLSSGGSGYSYKSANGGGGTAATGYYLQSASAHPVGIAFDAGNNMYVALYGNGGSSPSGSGCGSYTSGTKNIITLTKSSNYGSFVIGNSGGTDQTGIAIDNGNDTAGAVTGFTIVSGGSGYTTNPTVTISGGGGSGATATASAVGGAVSSLKITAAGTGYTTAPTVTISGGGGSGASVTANILITGSPFVWDLAEASGGTENHGTSGHYGFLFSSYTQSANNTAFSPGFSTTQGCASPSGSTSDSNALSPTTAIAANGSSTTTVDLFNNALAIAFDHSNNLWTANQVCVDAACKDTASLTKLSLVFSPPVVGSSTTNSKISTTASTYSTFTTGGMLATFPCVGSSCTTSTTPFKPLNIAIDGAGSVWTPNNGASTILAAVSNTGAGLAPASGFTGAIYNNGATAFQRVAQDTAGVAIDASGNVWLSNYTAVAAGPPAVNPATNVVQIVGAAVPVQTPIAAAAAANNLGNLP